MSLKLSEMIPAGTMVPKSEPEILADLLQETLAKLSGALQDERLEFLKNQANTATDPQPMLALMSNIIQSAWMQKSKDTSNILLVLAVASRDQILRPVFGGYIDQNFSPDDSILGYVLDKVLAEHKPLDDPGVLENALRLISNCVADTNCNRKLALQKHAVRNLMRLAKERRSVDFIIPAMYNLCVEYEDPGRSMNAGEPVTTRTNPAQAELARSDPHYGVIQAFFDISTGFCACSDQRKPLLASLIEMVSLTAQEDLLCIGILPEMKSQARRDTLHQTILMFLGVRSVPLTSYDGDTAVSVCNAFLNLLAAPDVKQVLVSERQLHSLASFCHRFSTYEQELFGEDGEEETLANLQQCEKALLQEFYVLSGLPEFAAAYTLDANTPGSDFIHACIDRPRNKDFSTQSAAPAGPSVAIAYTILANITSSEDIAIRLVHEYRAHEPLEAVLHDCDNADTIYPALGLLSRLSLPSTNKQEIVKGGMMDAIRRFFKKPSQDSSIDWTPAVRVEALTSLRRLITGQVGILTSLQERPRPGSYMQDILDLFLACNNSTIKIEIGRFCVECSRTISSTQDQIALRSRLSEQTFGQLNMVEPVAFLACEGPSPGAKAEGWFGLGLMTFWEKTRAQVLEILKTAQMVEEVSKIVNTFPSGNRASADNLKLVLSKLDFDADTTNGERHTRELFASAKQKLGLQHSAQ